MLTGKKTIIGAVLILLLVANSASALFHGPTLDAHAVNLIMQGAAFFGVTGLGHKAQRILAILAGEKDEG